MKPASACGCRGHEARSAGQRPKSKSISNPKNFRQAVLLYLRESEELPSDQFSICDICYKYANSQLADAPPVVRSSVEEILKAIRDNSISLDDQTNIAHALGVSQEKAIFNDTFTIGEMYKDEEQLANFKVDEYLENRNPVLRNFIEGCANVRDRDVNHKRTVAISMAIDNVYKARSLQLITPLAFSTNLMQYYSSGSKTVVNLFKSICPSGSYTTTTNWINNQSQDPIVLNEQGDVVTFFDNNQILARNWRVNVDSKALLSVITTVLHIIPNPVTCLQRDVALSPSVWLTRLSGDALLDKYTEYLDVCNGIFNAHRDAFVTSMLSDVHNIIEVGNSEDEQTDKNAPYDWVEDQHMGKPTLVMGEPVLANPCSYASVRRVLEEIRDTVKADGQQKWTVIGCDGLPYLLAARMIQEDDLLKDILLLPGLGHYEINMVRAVFRLLWVPFLCFVAKILGYRSLRALTCCQQCTNHHKAWQIIDITFHALAHELMYAYVQKCQSEHIAPQLQAYYTFVGAATDDNYIFLSNVVFTYIFALKMFRAGMRRNNHDVIMAARNKFSALFYGLNKTMYQDIDFRDNTMRLTAPDEILTFIRTHETFTASGHHSKGEGGDFVLENKNRCTKKWLPPGLPTEKHWLRVCRTIDKMDKIQSTVNLQLQLKDPDEDYTYHRDLITEIHVVREAVRNSGYLTHPNRGDAPHVSIDGIPLDHELVNFAGMCKSNRSDYITGAVQGKKVKLNQVFITPNDRTAFFNIEKKGKVAIEHLILQGVQQIRHLGRKDEADTLMAVWTKDKPRLTKAAYINFYNDVAMAVEDAEQRNDNAEDDAEEN